MWELWFAWRPIKINGKWYWLTWLKRKRAYYDAWDEFRCL